MKACSNFVSVAALHPLLDALEPFGITVVTQYGLVQLRFPGAIYAHMGFSPYHHVLPHLAEGQVLVLREVDELSMAFAEEAWLKRGGTTYLRLGVSASEQLADAAGLPLSHISQQF